MISFPTIKTLYKHTEENNSVDFLEKTYHIGVYGMKKKYLEHKRHIQKAIRKTNNNNNDTTKCRIGIDSALSESPVIERGWCWISEKGRERERGSRWKVREFEKKNFFTVTMMFIIWRRSMATHSNASTYVWYRLFYYLRSSFVYCMWNHRSDSESVAALSLSLCARAPWKEGKIHHRKYFIGIFCNI